MEADFNYLRKICPARKGSVCGELKYYDCSENNCPMNAKNAAQKAEVAGQNGLTTAPCCSGKAPTANSGIMATPKPCHNCEGKGFILRNDGIHLYCMDCHGSGAAS